MRGEQPDLLSWTPPPSDRYGCTFVRDFDFARLNAQQSRVFNLMRDGKFRTLAEIHAETGDPEASVSARLRDLRRPEFGGLTVDRQRQTDGGGTWLYRVDPASIPGVA